MLSTRCKSNAAHSIIGKQIDHFVVSFVRELLGIFISLNVIPFKWIFNEEFEKWPAPYKAQGQALVQVPMLRSAAHFFPLTISAHPNKSDMLAKENIAHTWLVQPPALNIICPKSLSNRRLIYFQLPSTIACHY